MAKDYLGGGRDYLTPLLPERSSGHDYLSGWAGSDLTTTNIEDDDDGIGLLTPISEFRKGLWSSLTTGNVEMLGGAAEAFAASRGEDPGESIGRRVQQWIGDPSRQTAKPMTWEEAEGPLGVIGYLAGLTGSGIGSMAAPLVAGVAGGAAGSLVAPGPGTVVGAVGGAFSTGAMLSIGETYLQLRDEGVDPTDAARWAIPVGAGLGVIETVGLSRVIGATVAKEVKSKAISAFIGEAAKGYARGATEEGLTEMAQSAVREGLTAALTGNPDLERRALSVLQEGLAGGLAGGAIAGAGRGGRAVIESRRERPTLAEQQPTARPDLLDGDGDSAGMDDLVRKGSDAIAALTGDTESNAVLEERGVPAVGSEVVYETPTGEQQGKVTGFIPADDFGPESLVLTDAEGIEIPVDLPLREGSTLKLLTDAQAEQDSDRFVADVSDIVQGADEQAALGTLMEEGGLKTLKAVPEDQRQAFVKDLKTRVDTLTKDVEDAQVKQDADLLFDEDVTDVRDGFEGEDAFTPAETTVREKMGLTAGEVVPPARRPTYLQLLKKEQARVKKAAAAVVEPAPAKTTVPKPAVVEPAVPKPAVVAAPPAPVAAPTPSTEKTLWEKAQPTGSKDPWYVRSKPAPARPRPADAGAHVPEAGQQDQVVLPDGATHSTRYEVVDAADLITSNVRIGTTVGGRNPRYIAELQPRDLSKTEEQLKISDIAQKGPDPIRLGRSNSADFGAPLVAEDNIVESGNGRALGIMIAYEQGNAAPYRAMVDQIADTSGMTAPVLIRRREGALSIDDRRKLTKDANRSTAARLSTTDQAMSDAEQISEGVFGLYYGGDLLRTKNADFVKQFINKTIPLNERNEFKAEEGGVSAAGLKRMEAAIVAHAYQSRRAVADLVADAEPDRKSVRNTLVGAAAGWAQMRDQIKAVDPKQDITQALNDAVALISRSVTNKMPIQNLFLQQSLIPDADPMTDGERGEVAKAVLRWFYQGDPFSKGADVKTSLIGQPKMQANMDRWIEAVNRYDPKQETMFGAVETPVDRLMQGDFAAPAAVEGGGSDLFSGVPEEPPAPASAPKKKPARATAKPVASNKKKPRFTMEEMRASKERADASRAAELEAMESIRSNNDTVDVEFSDAESVEELQALEGGGFFQGGEQDPLHDERSFEDEWAAVDPADPTNSRAFKAWFGDSKVVDEQGQPLKVYHSGAFDAGTDPVPRTAGGLGMHFGTKEAARQRVSGKRIEDEQRSVEAIFEEETDDGQSGWFWTANSAEQMEETDAFETEAEAIEAGQEEVKNIAEEQDSTYDEDESVTTGAFLSLQNPLRLRDMQQWEPWAVLQAAVRRKAVPRVEAEQIAQEFLGRPGETGGTGAWYVPREPGETKNEGKAYDAIRGALEKHGHDGIVYTNTVEDRQSQSFIAFKPEQVKSATDNRGTFDRSDPNILKSVEVRNSDGSGWRTITDDEFSAMRARIHEAAERIVPHAKVETKDASQIDVKGQKARGVYRSRGLASRIDPRVKPGLIQIAMASRDPEGVLRHEAIHAMRDMGLFTRNEWKTLQDAADAGKWRDKHRIAEFYSDPEIMLEEAIAFEFEERQWRQAVSEPKPGDSVVTRIMKKLARFMEAVRTTITGGKQAGPAERIFRMVESGEVGGRKPDTLRFKRGARLAVDKSYTFADPDAEKAYGRGKVRSSKASVMEFVKERGATFFQSFARIHRNLPQSTHWARAHDWLRELKEAPQIADDAVGAQLEKVVDGLDERQYDLLSRAVFVQSLAVDVKTKKDIPIFSSHEAWATEQKRLQAELRRPENKSVAQRIRLRRTHNTRLAERMVKADLIPKESLNDQDYITHRVLEYETEQRNVAKMSADLKSPKTKRRKGTKLDISTNFLETEALWMKKALVDVKIADTIAKFKDADYNQRPALIKDVNTENREQMNGRVLNEVRPILERAMVRPLTGEHPTLEDLGIKDFNSLNTWMKNLDSQTSSGRSSAGSSWSRRCTRPCRASALGWR